MYCENCGKLRVADKGGDNCLFCGFLFAPSVPPAPVIQERVRMWQSTGVSSLDTWQVIFEREAPAGLFGPRQP